MNNEYRLNSRHDADLEATSRQDQTQGHLFANPEEALRADRNLIQPPPALAQRLAASIAAQPKPPTTPWWKRLFGAP